MLMTTLQLIENKVPELTQSELVILLEKVVHSLKTYSVVQPNKPKPFNPENFYGAWKKLPIKDWDLEIKEMRNSWNRKF
jgi:hypothetical protein